MFIGNVELKNNVFLAPMVGVTDKPYRTICINMGCGLTYSEMVSAKGLFTTVLIQKSLWNVTKTAGHMQYSFLAQSRK